MNMTTNRISLQSLRATQTRIIGAIIPRMNSYAVDETVKV